MDSIDQEEEAEQTCNDPPTTTPPSCPHHLRPVVNPVVITQAPLLAEVSCSSFSGEGNPPPGHGDNNGDDDDNDDVILSFLLKSGLSDTKTTASPSNPALVVAAVGQ